MKRFSALFFCFILLFNIAVLAEEPKVNAISAVVVDGDTGRILWGKISLWQWQVQLKL